jgi:hypothetical protein
MGGKPLIEIDLRVFAIATHPQYMLRHDDPVHTLVFKTKKLKTSILSRVDSDHRNKIKHKT